MDIIESNKLIAEFMGGAKEEGGWNFCLSNFGHKVIGGYGFYESNNLRFNSSWDWLMPVVERIRTIASWDRDKFGTEVIINGNKTTIKSGGYGEKEHGKLFFNRTFHGSFNSKEHTYKAVVEFIQWYNQNQTS